MNTEVQITDVITGLLYAKVEEIMKHNVTAKTKIEISKDNMTVWYAEAELTAKLMIMVSNKKSKKFTK